MMPAVIFQGNLRDCRSDAPQRMQAVTRTHFFSGDLSYQAGLEDMGVRYELTDAQPISIVGFSSSAVASYRRTVNHIRQNRADLYLLWMINSGRLCTTQAGATEVALANSFAISSSDDPFLQKAAPLEDKPFDAKIAVIPGPLFRSHVPAWSGYLGKSISTATGSGRIVRELVNLLCSEAAELSVRAQNDLGRTTLSLVRETLLQSSMCNTQKASAEQLARDRVFSFIDANILNPDLSPRLVASGCSISVRYLHKIFESCETTFSRYVLDSRLGIAQEWLQDPSMQHHSVSSIASNACFSSNSHFSRTFRRAFGVTPRHHRSVSCGTRQ